MHYREFRPSPPLERYAERSSLGAERASQDRRLERVPGALVHLGDRIWRHDPKPILEPPSFLIGQLAWSLGLAPSERLSVVDYRYYDQSHFLREFQSFMGALILFCRMLRWPESFQSTDQLDRLLADR